MSIFIAGRAVAVGNALYHVGYQAWGVVKGFDASGPARLELNAGGGHKITLFVTNGGLINGKRLVYWHVPLTLDVPYADVSKFQALIDTAVEHFA